MKNVLNLPTPSKKNPYAQVDSLFKRVADTKRTQEAKSNYHYACTVFKNYLNKTNHFIKEENIINGFYLKKHLDEYTLVKFHSYLELYNKKGTEGYLSSHTISTVFSAIRKVVEYAILHGLAASENIINVSLPSSERETEDHEPFSFTEEEQIMNGLKIELTYVDKLLSRSGYEYTGIGQDPRVIPTRKGVPRGSQLPKEIGWKNIDNVRWYFENELNCVPLQGTPENRKVHNTYFNNCSNKFRHLGGLPGIYHLWGIAPLMTTTELMPLVVLLLSLTGLNPQSLLDLTVNCFNESHPLTGKPYIIYRKERSSGDKIYHVNLFDKSCSTKQFTTHKGDLIKNTFEKIIQLTQEIREKAPKEIQNMLLLVQSSSTRSFGEIIVLNNRSTSNWCQNFVRKYKIIDENGNPLKFYLVRFRPTRIARLVEQGVDIFHIQHEAGHKNISTTIGYLNRNRIDFEAKKQVHNALTTIHKNCQWAREEKPVYKKADDDTNSSNVVYKGILCDCKNPFNPPDFGRSTKKKGEACNKFNMCLLCPNVVIMKHHLPLLYNYGLQIRMILEQSENTFIHSDLYTQSLEVIESIFDENHTEFSDDEIDEAKKIGSRMDIIVDPLLYIPVK